MREFVVAFLRAGFTGRHNSTKSYFEACKSVFGIDQDHSSTAEVYLREKNMTEIRAVAEAALELTNVPESSWSTDILKERLLIIAQSLSRGEYGMLEDAERLNDPKYAYATLLHWIRWALVRAQRGPSIITIMSLYGRRFTMQRLEAARQTVDEVGEKGRKTTSSD